MQIKQKFTIHLILNWHKQSCYAQYCYSTRRLYIGLAVLILFYWTCRQKVQHSTRSESATLVAKRGLFTHTAEQLKTLVQYIGITCTGCTGTSLCKKKQQQVKHISNYPCVTGYLHIAQSVLGSPPFSNASMIGPHVVAYLHHMFMSQICSYYFSFYNIWPEQFWWIFFLFFLIFFFSNLKELSHQMDWDIVLEFFGGSSGLLLN